MSLVLFVLCQGRWIVSKIVSIARMVQVSKLKLGPWWKQQRKFAPIPVEIVAPVQVCCWCKSSLVQVWCEETGCCVKRSSSSWSSSSSSSGGSRESLEQEFGEGSSSRPAWLTGETCSTTLSLPPALCPYPSPPPPPPPPSPPPPLLLQANLLQVQLLFSMSSIFTHKTLLVEQQFCRPGWQFSSTFPCIGCQDSQP